MKCLCIIDLQNDFVKEGGKLVVPKATDIISKIQDLIDIANHKEMKIIFTRDWHPENAAEFNVWPKHCIQNTQGAEIIDELKSVAEIVVDKNELSAWSNPQTTKELAGAEEIYVTGCATNFCVKAFVLGARERNIKTYLIADAIAGVDLKPGDIHNAMVEMTKAGVILVNSKILGI